MKVKLQFNVDPVVDDVLRTEAGTLNISKSKLIRQICDRWFDDLIAQYGSLANYWQNRRDF